MKSKTSNIFPEYRVAYRCGELGFLTSHARVLLCIAHDPGAGLRDLAANLGITERSACAIVVELAQAGYVIKQKDGAPVEH
jgi:DNA-binding MarR family transcriptional regulator